MTNYLTNAFFGVQNFDKFMQGLQHTVSQVGGDGVFAGDNLFTFGKNLSFLGDEKFMGAVKAHAETNVEKATIWRTNVLCWAAQRGMKLEGDFMECACYKGTSARIVCDYVDFGSSDKHYYLYDLFEHDESMDHHAMPEHGEGLYRRVQQRFADFPNVHVTQGGVPEVLHQIAPEKISFMHLDINSAAAEIGALNLLFDRIVPGALIVLDDYGWAGYHEQKEAEDIFFAERGYTVLELPTGQGLVIK